MRPGLAGLADDLLGRTTIRIAVTGLSRAGKTVFLTSLLNNLLALPRFDTLPRLRRLLEGSDGSRLQDVRIVPAGVSAVPVFDYAGKLEGLAASEPHWPPRTDQIARIALDLELLRRGPFARALGPRRIRLEFLDYPGEWLLDLPMLARGFEPWSAAVLAPLRTGAAGAICAPFLAFLDGFDASAPADDAAIRRGHLLYAAAIRACATELGLRSLQPGRFLRPGPGGEAPLFWFFPDDRAVPAALGLDTAGGLLRARFEAYKARMRADLFDDHFSAFDRQIVLVDVLGALHAGQVSFKDTGRAIEEIALGLDYRLAGRTLLDEAGDVWRALGSLFGMAGVHRIERVAFVATKADHVPARMRPALARLLADMVAPSIGRRQFGVAPVSFHAAASVLSTRDDTVLIDGRRVEVVRGHLLAEPGAAQPSAAAPGAGARAFFAGDLPDGVPDARFWSGPPFALPSFAPPRIDPTGAYGLPHLGLDEILATLLEDVLR